MLKIIMGRNDYRNILSVIHNGKVIAQEYDNGEPEDNLFTRDYSWIINLLKKVYELGVEDGKDKMFKDIMGKKAK